MISAGDHNTKKIGGAAGDEHARMSWIIEDSNISPLATGHEPTDSVISSYVKNGSPKLREPGLYEKAAVFLSKLTRSFLPEMFGIRERIGKRPPAYADFSEIQSAGGAQVFYTESGGEIVLAGKLYDVSSFVHKFLDGSAGDPMGLSLGKIVSAIRESGRFTSLNDSVDFIHTRYDSSTKLYEVTIVPNPDISFHKMIVEFARAAKLFEETEEYEVEEVVGGASPRYADVMDALEKSLAYVKWPHARQIERMLADDLVGDPFGMEARHDLQNVTAGIRIGPDGSAEAVTIGVTEGQNFETSWISPAIFQFQNRALWIGRPSGKTIYWEVENSNPQNTDRAMQEKFIEYLEPLFRKDIVHVFMGLERVSENTDNGAPPSPGSSSEMSNSLMSNIDAPENSGSGESFAADISYNPFDLSCVMFVDLTGVARIEPVY